MSEIKVGDRVKVEYEGVVTYIPEDGSDIEVKGADGYFNVHSSGFTTITKLAPPEPPIGSVVVVRSNGDNEAQFRLVAYKRWASGWLNRNSEPVPWELVSQREIIAIHEPEAS